MQLQNKKYFYRRQGPIFSFSLDAMAADELARMQGARVSVAMQCCWNTVARSPNATHESTGRPKVLP